jgi:hypothetical protein
MEQKLVNIDNKEIIKIIVKKEDLVDGKYMVRLSGWEDDFTDKYILVVYEE